MLPLLFVLLFVLIGIIVLLCREIVWSMRNGKKKVQLNETTFARLQNDQNNVSLNNDMLTQFTKQVALANQTIAVNLLDVIQYLINNNASNQK